MPTIHVLSTHLVNKIAAGEVIERPASVVKELVENALDAGAARVGVAVEDGGRKLIAVTDDGGGMSAEDLALAFVPHATSKIVSEEDLDRIGTMGFRGEALASIASVSHAHIRTRRTQDAGGHEVEASGEKVSEVRPCPAAGGTTVTIRDLFFNTPARRKFLRTANTEFGHVSEHLARLALPQARVTFTLQHNGREVQNLPACASTAQRVADLFGPDIADGLMPIAGRGGRIGVAGLLGAPAAARNSSRWQYFFLNGRYIRDRVLAHALKEAYRGLIDPSTNPAAFVFLEMDPAEVDVNVHPTKIEVRFRDSQLVHGEVLAALRGTLNKADLTPSASLQEALREAPPPADAEKRRESLKQAMADFFRSTPPPQPRLSFPDHGPKPPPPRLPELPSASREAADPPASADPVEVASAGLLSSSPTPPPAPLARAIQFHNSYLVTDCEDGLLIVDQHALHERILYNELRQRLTEGKLTSQRLLIPLTMAVSPREAAALEGRADLLGRLGVEAAQFGPRTVAIHQFPSLLAQRGIAPEEFLRELLDLMLEHPADGDPEALLESVLSIMACKAAVKAGQALAPAEIDDLLARRDAAEKSSSCPHGRPTTLRLTLKDLEKQFHRT